MGHGTAIYPGSFDPPTHGHLDLIRRGSRLFEHLTVSLLTNRDKEALFTVAERVEMLKSVTRDIPNISVETFSGLLVRYAAQKDAAVVLRGIRAFSDFEYELQMALMNHQLEPHIETVFLMPAASYLHVSSRLVKEIAQHGGSIKELVPPMVEERLQQKIPELARGIS